MRNHLLPLRTVLFLALVVVGGCARAKVTAITDLPPTASVFVQFTPDSSNHTVNHLVHLYWFGSDPDGDVIGFDIRFVYPGQDPNPPWTRTAKSDSLIAVYTPTGYAAPFFQVRAVDNAGKMSPIATQQFSFTNQPPTLQILNRLRSTDTTFASLTITWNAVDPDGNAGNMKFLVWLDGQQLNPMITQQNPFTIPTSAFKQSGMLVSGPRTVWVQPVDDGGMMGNRDSMTWFMRAPLGGNHGRVLLLDDLPSGAVLPARFVFDSLYTNLLTRLLPGQVDIMRTEFTQPFRSAKDIQQTFALFDAVVWYRGPRVDVTPWLSSYQAGLDSSLAGGAKVFLEAQNLFQGQNATGILSPSFLTRYLDTDYLVMHQITGRFDSTITWAVPKYATFFAPHSGDSLRAFALGNYLQAFAVRNPAEIALLAPAGSLQPTNPIDLPVGLTVPTSAAGRFIVVTVPLAFMNANGTSEHALTEFLREFGLP